MKFLFASDSFKGSLTSQQIGTLLTLAALAQEIRSRGAPTECTVRIAAGLPLTSYGRDKPKFRSYLLRPSQPVQFR